ncbi:MAG: hydrogenase expression/formation protein HypE [Gammaproteobacteria bacterium]
MPLPDCITLSHGNGGRRMRELIDELIVAQLQGLLLESHNDATAVPLSGHDGEVMFCSDGFTVQPLEFPGGNIGSLAVNGTVNDLAVSGATPLYLSLNLIIEEGFATAQLRRILQGVAEAAGQAGVKIACGDTKVVPRGECSGIYITTSGIGIKPGGVRLAMDNIQEGDAIIVSGSLGDHGTAVMLAREAFGLSGSLLSDCASVRPLCEAIRHLPGVRFMRDPTRGGAATVLHEILQQRGLGSTIKQAQLPFHEATQGICEILGYDPLYLACEGRVMAVVAQPMVEQVLQQWQALEHGGNAACIGVIQGEHVILETELGGERFIDELGDEPLPRIC